MLISELDYSLPPELIATTPAEKRDQSRLLVYHRNTATIEHKIFHDLPQYLHPNDLLILNNTRVLPAKLTLHRKSGAKITGLFLHESSPGTWNALLRTRGKVAEGEQLLAGPYVFSLTKRLGEGQWQLAIIPPNPATQILQEIGQTPLPPYIEKRRQDLHTSPQNDKERYQTIYAQNPQQAKSVAAPTAGLHFTPELLQTLAQKGIQHAPIELEVGLGTFLPVETETLEQHPMHAETYHIPATSITAIRQARQQKSRIIAVGTTAVRTLESAAQQILSTQPPQDLHQSTTLKIAPGHPFQLTDALITNFHLPKSTLMALVAAFLEPNGIQHLQQLYAIAINQRYRFYSYGDAMLIL